MNYLHFNKPLEELVVICLCDEQFRSEEEARAMFKRHTHVVTNGIMAGGHPRTIAMALEMAEADQAKHEPTP